MLGKLKIKRIVYCIMFSMGFLVFKGYAADKASKSSKDGSLFPSLPYM